MVEHHAETSGDRAGLVAQDVAEQVVGEDDVEGTGVAGELIGRIVGIEVGQLDVRVTVRLKVILVLP